MNSKKDLNEKFISFLEQTKDDTHNSVTHLNDRVLIVDGLNTFIRSFAVNPSINDDGLHIGGMMGFLKSIRYTSDILKPSRVVVVFDGKDGSKRSHGEWASKNNFKWYTSDTLPEEWRSDERLEEQLA